MRRVAQDHAGSSGQTLPAVTDGRFAVIPCGRPACEREDGRVTRVRGWGLAVVRGRSMLPTLRDGDRLLVRWGPREPRPGRLVVVQLPGGRPVSVKRLTGRQDGGWWVERDNPAEGADSWQLGAIPPGDLLGVVIGRVWPRPGRLGDRGIA